MTSPIKGEMTPSKYISEFVYTNLVLVKDFLKFYNGILTLWGVRPKTYKICGFKQTYN